MTRGRDWVEVQATLAELAAGIAESYDRQRALEHLSGCAICRRELAANADVVDELLLLAPVVKPPTGLASAVLAQLEPDPPQARPQPPQLLRVASFVIALILAAGIAAGAIWWRTADDRELAREYRHTLAVAHGEGLSAARVVAEGRGEIGTMFAYEGEPSWVYATFRQPPAPGQYQVRLITKTGQTFALRPLAAKADTSAWGSIVKVSTEQIRAIEFVRSDGPMVAARFE